MERVIWINGAYTISHFVPSIAVIKDLDYIEISEEFVERWIRAGSEHQLRVERFRELVAVDDLALLLNIVFNNSVYTETGMARMDKLAIDLFLCGISATVSPEPCVTRNDAITKFVKKNLDRLIALLMRISSQIPISRKSSTSPLLILDILFEAMDVQPLRDSPYLADQTIRIPGEVLPISNVLHTQCLEPSQIASEIRKYLCSDPFDIDGMDLDAQPSTSSSTRKSTTCAPIGRRRVKIMKWKRIQVLTKSTYRNVHLVLGDCNSEETSMLFSPYSALSVTLHDIHNCSAIVLGPTNGPVIIRNCSKITVSVVCSSIFVINCESIRVFYASYKPLVILGSKDVRTSYFNVPHTGLEDELHSAGLNLQNMCSRRDILGDEPKEAEFYIQPVPYTVRDVDELFILSHLPEDVRDSWLQDPVLDKENEEDTPQWQLPKKDLLYLKSKISNK